MNFKKFTKKQLEKSADQIRLLSWAQGAILTSTSGFKLPLNYEIIILIMLLWVFFQVIALIIDKESEK